MKVCVCVPSNFKAPYLKTYCATEAYISVIYYSIWTILVPSEKKLKYLKYMWQFQLSLIFF